MTKPRLNLNFFHGSKMQWNMCLFFADKNSWLLFYTVFMRFMAGVCWQNWNRRYWWTRTSICQTHLLHVDTFAEEWTLTTVWYRGATCKWKWCTMGIDNVRLFSWRLKIVYVRMCETGACINNMFLFFVCFFLVFKATFCNISAISWRPVLVVEEAGISGENHRPSASNWSAVSLQIECTLFVLIIRTQRTEDDDIFERDSNGKQQPYGHI